LLDRVTQRQDAQIPQMQQGIFAIFGMVQQVITHTRLVLQQQAGLQGMSAPALALTPTLATATVLGFPTQLSSRLYHRCRSSSHLLGLHYLQRQQRVSSSSSHQRSHPCSSLHLSYNSRLSPSAQCLLWTTATMTPVASLPCLALRLLSLPFCA
jgi:hypothetical protein